MNFHSKINAIRPFDIFYASRINDRGEKKTHYYLCIYTQKDDDNNDLTNDVCGLFITTNPKYNKIKDAYVVNVEIYGKPAFICCDKIERFFVTDDIEIKSAKISPEKMSEVIERYNYFVNETNRQLAEAVSDI